MRCLRHTLAALVIPAWALLAVGCGSDKPVEKPAEHGTPATRAKTDPAGGSSKSGGGKEEVASKGAGTVKGRVVFDGDPPRPAALEINKDGEHCKKGPPDELTDPTWRVGSDKGVANVIVWVQAPA